MRMDCRNTPVIETERLILRTVTKEDAADLKKWLGREEVYTYWGRKASEGEKNPESLFMDPRSWVKRKPGKDLHWGVLLKSTGEVMGDVTVHDVQNGWMVSISFPLNPDEWGKGYATEAVGAAVEYAFDQVKLQRLEATVDVRNRVGIRVLEKCGFLREDIVRQGKKMSVSCDHHIYGLLQTDRGKKAKNCKFLIIFKKSSRQMENFML